MFVPVSPSFPNFLISAGFSVYHSIMINYALGTFSQYVTLTDKTVAFVEDERIGPLTAPRTLNPNFEYDFKVYCTKTEGFWQKYLYQLSHELTHVFSNCFPSDKRYSWILEILADMSSLIFSYEFSRASVAKCFYSTLDSQSLSTYYDNTIAHITDDDRVLSLSELYQKYKFDLATDEHGPVNAEKTCRTRNTAIAHGIVKEIEHPKALWSILPQVPDGINIDNNEQFFDVWLNCIPESNIDGKRQLQLLMGKLFAK